MLRTVPVDSAVLGLVSAGQPDPVMPWVERDGRRQPGTEQERDETTDMPVWSVYVLPTAAERPEVLILRVPAKQQPVLTMFGPIEVTGLTVNLRVDKAMKLAQYWNASEVRDAAPAGRRNGQPEHKPETQAA